MRSTRRDQSRIQNSSSSDNNMSHTGRISRTCELVARTYIHARDKNIDVGSIFAGSWLPALLLLLLLLLLVLMKTLHPALHSLLTASLMLSSPPPWLLSSCDISCDFFFLSPHVYTHACR